AVARRRAAANARRTRPCAADSAAGIEQVAAVGRRESLARSVEVETAHLDAVSSLPDAVEHGAMTLVGGRQSVLLAERRLHRERDRIPHADRRGRLRAAVR